MIAENELFGAQTPTPWSATNAQYRANVLALLQELDDARRDAGDHDREPAVHRRRRGRLVARGREGGDPDPPGLLHLARPEGPLQARPRRARAARCGRACAASSRTSPQIGIPAGRVALELQFQSAPGQGGRQGLQPTCGVARDREARGARREAGRRGDEDRGRLVVGLAELLRRRQRPGQAARPRASTSGRATRSSATARRSPAPGSTRRSPRARSSLPAGVRCTLGAQHDPEGRRRPHRGADGRPRLCRDARCCSARCCAPRSRSTRLTVLSAERAIVRDRFGGSALALSRCTRRRCSSTLPTRARSSPTGSRATASRSASGRGAATQRDRRLLCDVRRRRTSASSPSTPARRGSAASTAASRSRRSRPSRSSRSGRASGGRSTRSTVASPCAPLGPSLPLYRAGARRAP